MKSYAEEKGRGPELGEFPKMCRFPFYIYTMAEASDFKSGTQLGFVKAHHNITPIGKSECGLAGLRIFLKILDFPCNG